MNNKCKVTLQSNDEIKVGDVVFYKIHRNAGAYVVVEEIKSWLGRPTGKVRISGFTSYNVGGSHKETVIVYAAELVVGVIDA